MHGHESWLLIAKEDLFAAKTLMSVELFSTATYLCQQSAEKTLKAYLAFSKQEITKTHDLVQLVRLCLKIDKTFEVLFDPAEQLVPFATRFRYPSEYDIPSLEHAEEAIKQAQKIMTFILRKISKKTAELETGQIDLF